MHQPWKIAASIFMAFTCTACFFRTPESIIEGEWAESTLDPAQDLHACVASALANVDGVFIDEASRESSLRTIAIKTSRGQISGDVREEDDGHVRIFIGAFAGPHLSWSDSRFSARKAKAIAAAMSQQCGGKERST